MVLKLCGSKTPVAMRRAAVVLKEKNIPYEIVPVDFVAKEHKSLAYVEKQPFGQCHTW